MVQSGTAESVTLWISAGEMIDLMRAIAGGALVAVTICDERGRVALLGAVACPQRGVAGSTFRDVSPALAGFSGAPNPGGGEPPPGYRPACCPYFTSMHGGECK